MSEFRDEAMEKLRSGVKSVEGQKERAMKDAVREALEDFRNLPRPLCRAAALQTA